MVLESILCSVRSSCSIVVLICIRKLCKAWKKEWVSGWTLSQLKYDRVDSFALDCSYFLAKGPFTMFKFCCKLFKFYLVGVPK